MIASVYRLSRKDMKELKITDAYSIHRAVYSLFPQIDKSTRDFLYVDKGGDFLTRQILMLSERAPIHPAVGLVESKPIPENFITHERYGFEVKMNPVRQENKSRKRVPVKGRDLLMSWFCEKAGSYGFSVDATSLDVRDLEVLKFTNDENQVTYNSAVFIGKLTVTDRVLFEKSFKEGIGRAKGFGFGLLQIVPLKN